MRCCQGLNKYRWFKEKKKKVILNFYFSKRPNTWLHTMRHTCIDPSVKAVKRQSVGNQGKVTHRVPPNGTKDVDLCSEETGVKKECCGIEMKTCSFLSQ